jgi:endonuclease/exonuclease/phosphatase family metal-dependent hydrolase
LIVLRFLAWALCALILLVFLAGYAARYVHPRTLWELQLAAVFLPLAAGAVVVACLILAASGARLALVPYLVLAVLAGIRFLPSAWMSPVAPAGEELRILSFNGKPQAARPGAGTHLEQQLQRLEPHVLAFQEVPIRQPGDRQGLYGDATYLPPVVRQGYRAEFPAGAPFEPLRLPVFTTLTWHDFAVLAFDAPPPFEDDWQRDEDEDDAPRPYYRAELELGGRRFAVYNVHLHSFGSRRPWKNQTWRNRLAPRAWVRALRSYRYDFLVRAAQAEDLRTQLDREELPFLVAGDFNSTPHHWSFGHIARDLTDTFRSRGRGWYGTYHSRLRIVRIDHVLASGEWHVRDARVLTRPRSDHLPFFATLVLPTDPPPSDDSVPSAD